MHAFRFGLVAFAARDGEDWVRQAREAEALGYTTLLVPDNLAGLAPFPALATAAAATSLRVGTYVLAAPLRPAPAVAAEAATLDLLTGGRLELGVGAGRPDAEQEARALGMPFGTPAQRVAQVAEVIRAVRARTPDTRVLVAGSGRRLLTLAAQVADIVAIGAGPTADDAAMAAKAAVVRKAAGQRFGDLELTSNLIAAGETTPPWLEQRLGLRVSDLVAAGSAAVLTGSTGAMVDRLLRRRDEAGISYVTINAGFATALAPVVQRLAGA